MSDVDDLKNLVITFRDERNWQQFHQPKDLAISLLLEAAELLEHFQWKSTKEFDAHMRDHKDDVADELMDVLYWVLLMCNDLDIDITSHFKRKLAKNAVKYPIEKSKDSHQKYSDLKD